MGEISIAMSEFLRNKRRFADLFNSFYFQGREVIKAEELCEGSEQYEMSENETGGGKEILKLKERQRDVKMFLKSGTMLRVLAVENQTAVDGSRSLRDMMDFGEDADGMSEFFSDYSFGLFCLNEQADFEMLHTELKEVFLALKFRKDKAGMRKLMQENEVYHHLNEETLMVLSKLLGQPQIWEDRAKYMCQKECGEEYDMCQALKEWMEDERTEGRAEGRSEMLMLVSKMLLAGDSERIPQLSDEGFMEEMCRMYGV